MKKIMTLLLAAAMLLSVIALSSCGLPSLEELESKLGELIEQTDEGGNPIDDGNSGSENDLPYSRDSAQAKLEELGKTEGYEVTLKVTGADGTQNVTVTGRKGNVWWSYAEDKSSGSAIMDNNGASITSYELSNQEWSMGQTLAGQDFSSILTLYSTTTNVYLFFANTYDGSLEYDGKGTVAGRACSKYTYSIATLGASISYEACVDDELGITLKWLMKTTAAGQSGSQQTEVLSFKTGSDVKLPDLPTPGEDYMDVSGAMGWPSNSYTALIPKAPGTLGLSMIQDGQFAAMLKDVTESDFNSYVSSVKSKGFNGDVQGTTFEGTDAKGNTVKVILSDGQLAVSVVKAN